MTTIAHLTRENKQRFMWGLKNVCIFCIGSLGQWAIYNMPSVIRHSEITEVNPGRVGLVLGWVTVSA